MVADISDVHQGVLEELPLDREVVVLNVAVAGVARDPGDVVGGWIEACDQAARKSLLNRCIAAWYRAAGRNDLRGQWCGAMVGWCRRILRHSGELSLRSVDGQDVARAGARVVHKPEAESSTNGNRRYR